MWARGQHRFDERQRDLLRRGEAGRVLPRCDGGDALLGLSRVAQIARVQEGQVGAADSIGLALLVVLESLTPAERLAFVLHDMFGIAFEDIAGIVDRSPAAARKLASRARGRVRGIEPEPDPVTQRRAVGAFLAAARDGDFDALVAVLHPDVVLRADNGPTTHGGVRVLRGVDAVAGQLATFHQMATTSRTRHALVNGVAGLVNTVDGDLFSIIGFTVVEEKIAAIDILSDPERLASLDLADL